MRITWFSDKTCLKSFRLALDERRDKRLLLRSTRVKISRVLICLTPTVAVIRNNAFVASNNNRGSRVAQANEPQKIRKPDAGGRSRRLRRPRRFSRPRLRPGRGPLVPERASSRAGASRHRGEEESRPSAGRSESLGPQQRSCEEKPERSAEKRKSALSVCSPVSL